MINYIRIKFSINLFKMDTVKDSSQSLDYADNENEVYLHKNVVLNSEK